MEIALSAVRWMGRSAVQEQRGLSGAASIVAVELRARAHRRTRAPIAIGSAPASADDAPLAGRRAEEHSRCEKVRRRKGRVRRMRRRQRQRNCGYRLTPAASRNRLQMDDHGL